MSFVCVLWVLIPLKINAAAWLQEKNHGQVIGYAQQYTSCKYWNLQGDLKDGPCFRQFAVAPYIEYGLLEKFNLIVSPNFNQFSQSGSAVPFGAENGMVGGKYSLWKKDWTEISAQVIYNQPFRPGLFGNPAIPSAVYALIDRQRFVDARLLYGKGGTFDKEQYNTWYADAETSFQDNFSGAADEVHFDFMLGWKTFHGKLAFEIQEKNAITLNNPRNITFPNYNLSTFFADIVYWYFPSAAIQLGVQQDFYGKNIGQGTAPFIALWWKFQCK
jgi:hypothetical protein